MRKTEPLPRASRLEWIYGQPPLVRIAGLWLVTFAVLFASFGIHLWLGDGYEGTPAGPLETESALEVLAIAVPVNLANAAFIGVASLLFRFGPLNPGTLYLLVLAIFIGRIAGLNDFQYPMEDVAAGLAQFARVGLWELTAYVIVAAVTMTKSRWIADRPFAKEWRSVRAWRDIEWSRAEVVWLVVAVLLIVGAAFVEGVTIAERG